MSMNDQRHAKGAWVYYGGFIGSNPQNDFFYCWKKPKL